jgi:hypothetical protein
MKIWNSDRLLHEPIKGENPLIERLAAKAIKTIYLNFQKSNLAVLSY